MGYMGYMAMVPFGHLPCPPGPLGPDVLHCHSPGPIQRQQIPQLRPFYRAHHALRGSAARISAGIPATAASATAPASLASRSLARC